MDYNFYSLNPRTFEQLIQSLARKLLGNGMITFGDGPDGGREAVFDGRAPFPGPKDCREGRWILQAKFKSRVAHAQDDHKANFNWVKKEFQQEMKKFASRKVKGGIPHNYLFFTNEKGIFACPHFSPWYGSILAGHLSLLLSNFG